MKLRICNINLMEFLKKNKAVVAVILVIVLGLIGYVVWAGNSAQRSASQVEAEKEVIEMAPEDIGLVLSLRSDNKAVIIKVTKLDGIKSLEYELSYDAEVTEEGETHNIPRGAVGEFDIEPGAKEVEREVDLGTCSANVCKYDIVTSEIKVLIKVGLENGNTGAVEDTIAIEEE